MITRAKISTVRPPGGAYSRAALINFFVPDAALIRGRRLRGLCQLGGMRNRVPALTEQFEIAVPTFSNTVGEVRKPFPSA